MTKKQRYDAVLQWFEQNMPIAESELVFHNEYELLVAVMLSAQCTDKRVNMVTPKLFEQYPTPQTLAQASEEDIFQIIRSISYPNAKAKHLKGMAEKLISDYQGQVPNTVEALQTLPGVGRKTANVVCAVAWNQPTMAVDTHIFRVSERIGLTTHSKNPLQTEKQLIQYIPKELIPKAHHWLLLHGRYICQARKPKCKECGIREWCASAKE
jgi:endonuclease-3